LRKINIDPKYLQPRQISFVVRLNHYRSTQNHTRLSASLSPIMTFCPVSAAAACGAVLLLFMQGIENLFSFHQQPPC
jgi:hypothetical protein